MTVQEKLIKNKPGLLELASYLGNVSLLPCTFSLIYLIISFPSGMIVFEGQGGEKWRLSIASPR